jgi:hypothetical protein
VAIRSLVIYLGFAVISEGIPPPRACSAFWRDVGRRHAATQAPADQRAASSAGPVLIDAHVVGEQETGNETYTVNLLRSLAQVNRDDQIVAAAPGERRAPCSGRTELHGGSRVRESSATAVARPARADLSPGRGRFCVTYTGPTPPDARSTMVRGVTFKRHPEWFSPRDRIA